MPRRNNIERNYGLDFEKGESNEIKSNIFHFNSFKINTRPKKSSCDVKNFLQIYRKKCRTIAIEKQFQHSMEKFNSPQASYYKGFKGSMLTIKCNNHFVKKRKIQRPHTSKIETNYYSTQTFDKNKSDTKLQGFNNQDKFNTIGVQQIKLEHKEISLRRKYHKPNLMYNISLYKTRNKTRNIKNDSDKKLSIFRSTR